MSTEFVGALNRLRELENRRPEFLAEPRLIRYLTICCLTCSVLLESSYTVHDGYPVLFCWIDVRVEPYRGILGAFGALPNGDDRKH